VNKNHIKNEQRVKPLLAFCVMMGLKADDFITPHHHRMND
jgi:hypothetical protein